MIGDNTDRSWEALGKSDPYYGVLTCDKFRHANLDPSTRREFFASGERHMVDLLARVEGLLGPVGRGRALDFGCGVGRLAIPLARDGRFTAVTGVDISESMLQEARRNAAEVKLTNVDFVGSDDGLSKLNGSYDFVHSYIVLQHIPVERGEAIVRQLVSRLAPGGVAALQMPFARNVSTLRSLANFLRVRVGALHVIGNMIQGRPWNEAPMQMNRYNLNSLFEILYQAGIPHATAEFLNDGGNIGAYIFVRKPV